MIEPSKILPFTERLTNTSNKWSFIFAYNLKTIRDIFVYCSLNELTEEKLYEVLKNNIILPPKEKWINESVKRKERLRLEYIHATKYLNLLTKIGDRLLLDRKEFEREKNIIVNENKFRKFEDEEVSPNFTEKEINALRAVIFNYERATDFLKWFYLNKQKFDEPFTFDKFLENSKPLYILGKTSSTKKGREIVKIEGITEPFLIPNKAPYDYTRFVSYVAPNWFIDLKVIDKVIVFPEFSNDKSLWHMYYPIKMNDKDFLKLDFKKFLNDTFLKDLRESTIWLPYLIYITVKKHYCSVNAVRLALEKLFMKNFSHYYLDRASFSGIMNKAQYDSYMSSYLKIDGFYRSHLKIFKD